MALEQIDDWQEDGVVGDPLPGQPTPAVPVSPPVAQRVTDSLRRLRQRGVQGLGRPDPRIPRVYPGKLDRHHRVWCALRWLCVCCLM